MHIIKGLHRDFNLELRINGNSKPRNFKFLLLTGGFLTAQVRSPNDTLQTGKDKAVGQNETTSLRAPLRLCKLCTGLLQPPECGRSGKI